MASARRYNLGGVIEPAKKPQQRRAERVRLGALRVDVQSGPTGTLVDLSEGGTLLDLPLPQEVDGAIALDVHFDGTLLSLRGRVVRSIPRYPRQRRAMWIRPAGYYVAVEFIDLAPESATALQDILQKARERLP